MLIHHPKITCSHGYASYQTLSYTHADHPLPIDSFLVSENKHVGWLSPILTSSERQSSVNSLSVMLCYAMSMCIYACSHAIGTFLHRSPLTTMIGALRPFGKGQNGNDAGPRSNSCCSSYANLTRIRTRCDRCLPGPDLCSSSYNPQCERDQRH